MPGIHLYTGNRLEILADRFAELLQSNPLPPLQKETILVQSRGMARWLALETAARTSIWANIECPFPNTFIRSINGLLLPGIPDIMLFEKQFITWHLMAILPGLLPEPDFHKVRSYLASGDDLKLYQLAHEIADLFDQYTLYRPDMILAWEKGRTAQPTEEAWQATLWRHLIEHLRHNQTFSDLHRARLLEMLQEKLQDPGLDCSFLPPRVTVFGISSLPPYHLAVLSALARHIDLYFFVMNPCREYWLDIIADRDIVKISKKEAVKEDMLHLVQGNSLLASMGHLGRDFMTLLQELDPNEQEFFSDPSPTTLLAGIQQDILYLREIQDSSVQPTSNRKKIINSDRSIIFQSCHSPMREIETLHDNLLEIFNRANEEEPLEPRDILVMAPDINEYAPFIRAVFGAERTSLKIPYSISDQSIETSSQHIESFLKIISLSESRLTSVDVMSLLDSAPIRNRFSFSDQDLSILQQWITDTRICWGINAEHRKKLRLPDYRENSWRAGLDRLLLGYAMPGRDRNLFKKILPYDFMEGSNTDLLGSFLDFCENLFNLFTQLKQHHTLAEWSTLLLQAKDDFLLADEMTAVEDTILHQTLAELFELQSLTSFMTPVSINVIQSFLLAVLEERYATAAGSSGFLTGRITFCSMLPMRAIPFKAIYLLGMNDGSYPRPGRRRSFDITALEPRRGDRSRRHDDRYLFLETLLSARKQLFISYVGQSVQDGSKRPPSVLVSELMDYIEQNYAFEIQGDSSADIIDHLTMHHKLQPFHPEYFRIPPHRNYDTLFSYSRENSDAAAAIANIAQKSGTLFSSPLPPPPEEFRQVGIDELVRFYLHPARYILRKRIGIAAIEEFRSLQTSELFEIKGLDRYVLGNDILAHISAGGDLESLYQVKKAAGQLPHGRMGKVYFSRIVTEAQTFQKTIEELASGQKLEKLEISLDVGCFTLAGHLDNVGATGLVQYRYAVIKPKDLIRGWIFHLALNHYRKSEISDSMKHTFVAGKNKTFQYLPVAEDSTLLEELLSLYWLGLCEPLHFFPQASFVFARALHSGKSEQEAMLLATSEWEGNMYTGPGEKYDLYNSLCFKNLELPEKSFADLAKKIFLPILAHQVTYKR
jgi:exodeoxyribonuclease V gamma subunit